MSQSPSPPDAQPTVPPKPSPEDAAKLVALQKRLAATFGEIVAVLMHSGRHKHLFLTDLEWLILPAVASGQFALAEARNKESGLTSPVAPILWASVSEEVDARIASNLGQAPRLKPGEWASGQTAWLVEAVGEPRAVQTLLDQTLAGPRKGRALKVAGRGPDGKPTIQVLRGTVGAAASGNASVSKIGA